MDFRTFHVVQLSAGRDCANTVLVEENQKSIAEMAVDEANQRAIQQLDEIR